MIYFDTDLISPPFFVNCFLVKPGSAFPASLLFSSRLLSRRDGYSASLPSWRGAQTGDSAGSRQGDVTAHARKATGATLSKGRSDLAIEPWMLYKPHLLGLPEAEIKSQHGKG